MSDDHQTQDERDEKIARRRRMLKLMGLGLATSFVAPMALGLNEANAQRYDDWRYRRRSRSRSRRSRSRDDRRWRGRYSRRRNWRGRRRGSRSRSRRSRSRD